jgi:hypothetical protein
MADWQSDGPPSDKMLEEMARWREGSERPEEAAEDWRPGFWREVRYMGCGFIVSLVCAVAVAILWGWNPYIVWSAIWGSWTLGRVYALRRREGSVDRGQEDA